MLKSGDNLDVIFEAGEDLYNHNKSQILLLKHASIRIGIIKARKFLSYCHEFCGMTGISYKTVRFLSLGRDINQEIKLNSNCLIKVLHAAEFSLMVSNPLKSSLQNLYKNGNYSDIVVNINEEIKIPVHKCILSSRSQKFETMFSLQFQENETHQVKINCKKPKLFEKMMLWIYCGELQFPEDIFDVFDLMILADEYFLNDLKSRCEEDMLLKIDESNVFKMLLLCEKHSIVSQEIQDKCKSLFIEEFNKIIISNPNLENEIIKIPGLMTKLFLHINKNKKGKKRRVTFVFEEHLDDS